MHTGLPNHNVLLAGESNRQLGPKGIQPPPTPPSIIPALGWNNVIGGVDLSFQVLGVTSLSADQAISVRWSKGGESDGGPVFNYTVKAGTPPGKYKASNIGGQILEIVSVEGTKFLARSSSGGVATLDDVKVSFDSTANGAVVSKGMMELLKDGLRAAGQAAARVSSTQRSPADQARAMFQNLISTAQSIEENIKRQLQLYGPNGDKVIQVFAEMTTGKSRAEITSIADAIKAKMEAKIVEIGPSNVSTHCADPSIKSVIDVPTAVFASTNIDIFYKFAQPRATKFIDERTINGCFHLELLNNATSPITKEKLQLKKGELTIQGEGVQNKIYPPPTASSGVTLGIGYDLGSRSSASVKLDLTKAGMSTIQAEKIAKGAGLKGATATEWVKLNEKDVGTWDKNITLALFATLLPKYTAEAKNLATSLVPSPASNAVNARSREIRYNKALYTYVMKEEQWTGLHPAMVELLSDLKFQGGYYAYDRINFINERLIKHHGNHTNQFVSVAELFGFNIKPAGTTRSKMDEYAVNVVGETLGNKETFYGVSATDLAGASSRRNRIRLAYQTVVIRALQKGQEVVLK